MQYTGKEDGKMHCVLLDALTEIEATLEALDEGFEVESVGYADKIPDA